MEAAEFQGVIITDAAGTQKSDFKPGETVRCEAVFSLDAPGMAIVTGTVSGGSWSEPLGLRIRAGLKATYNVSWTVQIPFSVRGTARADVICYIPLLNKRLVRTGFFTVAPIQADYAGADACKTCHAAVYDAWSATLHFPAIDCEACHGTAGVHITTFSADDIAVDRSSALCSRCHIRNDGTVIEAEGGFIKGQQQYNEWRSSAHGAALDCSDCHNPHYSVSGDRQNAITASCISCHGAKTVSLNMQAVSCEGCHMPWAVSAETSEGFGLYRTGDTASHIWRIKIDAGPAEMFTSGETAVMQDGQGPFLTLNFACLGCHNGREAWFETFDAVQQTATLVH